MKKLFLILFVLIALAVLVSVASVLLSGRPREASFGAPRVLSVTLSDLVLDYSPAPQIPFFQAEEPISLATLFRAFRNARKDNEIKGLAIRIEDARMGLAKAQELRRQLLAFSSSGKFVDCYMEAAGEGTNGTLDYYLASACDRIVLAPVGDVNLVGLYFDSLFLRGTLEKLKIEAEFDHVGDYKSAAETWEEYGHSEAAREALSAVLDGFYRQIVAAIAEARHLDESDVESIIDSAPYTARQALDLGLIDGLGYPDEFDDLVADRLEDTPRHVPVQSYLLESSGAFGHDKIAILFAQGTIVRGDGGVDPWTREIFMGSGSFVEELARLAEDDSVAAIVLRVDSPGGSALASDLILRAVELASESKPVIVSMSGLAASGGYYISAKAARIVAEPATLTGSIGVVAGKLVTRQFEEELLGMTHDTLQRGANASFFSSTERFSERQAERFRELMLDVYDTFVDHVAAGRTMTREEVLAVAGGRIWTGEDAVELGLVDELGGLDRAIEIAAELAGIPAGADAPIVYYPKPPTWRELLEQGRLISAPDYRQLIRRALEPASPRTLQIPAEIARFSQPF